MTDTRLVLDIETKHTFDEVGGRNQFAKLGVSVVGVYDYGTDKYECYLEKDFGRLQNRLIDCSLIIGFNHTFFDMPVLQPFLSIDVKTLPLFDIMLDLQEKIGHRVGLDSVAQATLGTGKTGNGLDAIRYYREGRWDELKKYCLKDVEVTRKVYEHGLKNKVVSYSSKFGHERRDVKVNWSDFGKKSVEKAFNAKPLDQAQYKLF